MTVYNSIVVPLAFISGVWIPATLLCCIPWVQKQMLYLHRVTLWPGKWLDEPERAGFLKNQVAPFRILTKDGERIFAWLIAPLGVYSRHAQAFFEAKPKIEDIEQTPAFRVLRDDPEARLVIYFHGNTATLAQSRRTEEYRMYSSGASNKIFALAFDYRGFGKSTGVPSETGLLSDAEAVIEWALDTAGIPPERIVLLGHSLGTAVVAGIAHRYVNLVTPVEFAGMILCAAFTNTGNAFSVYSIADVVPILSPVRLMPPLQVWFNRRFKDSWQTDRRLVALAKQSAKFRLMLVHAEDDGTMPYLQTEELFKLTLKAATEEGDARSTIIDLGEAGRQETWSVDRKSISKLIAKHGDHNTMMKWSPISLAITEMFGLAQCSSDVAIS